MADDDDPTVATPSDLTQPLPPIPERQSEVPPEPPSGWRAGQVAVVVVLALLLGGAGGAVIFFATDEDAPESAGVVDATTTTTSTTTVGDDPVVATTSTTEADPDPTTTRPSGGGDQDQGGQTAVGNGIFTSTSQSNQDRSIDDVDVDDDWKVRWDVPAGAIAIDVFDSGGNVVEAIDAQGRGERSFAEGGTYRVEIDTDGSRYTVVITDGP